MIKAPEVIKGWRYTQLSIARFYGGCTYNGHKYVIDENDDLVRQDVMRRRKKNVSALAEVERAKWEGVQADLLAQHEKEE